MRALFDELYHPDVEFDWSRTTPDGTTATGIDALFEWMGLSRDAMSEVTFEPLDVIEAANDLLVVPTRVTGRGGASGVVLTMDYVYVNRLARDGRIIFSRTYRSLPEALDAAQGLS